jgi:hypothetical protein
MSIGIELMCDVRSPRKDKFGSPVCHTDRKDNVGEIVGNDTEDVRASGVRLFREAMEQGWEFAGGKWFCPGCRK